MNWEWCGSSATSCSFRVHLPLSGWSVLRIFSVSPTQPTTLTIESRFCHESDQPLRLEVCEHTTLGNSFLDGCEIKATIGEVAYEMPVDGSEDAPGQLPSAVALEIPKVDAPPEGSVRVAPVVPAADGAAWWRAENAALRRRLTVAWKSQDFPWLCLWTEHKKRTHAPWHARERTRGLEISTKPFPQVPHPTRAAEFLGVPTTLVCAPGEEIVRRVRFKWEEI